MAAPLARALAMRLKPILFLNKIDRLIYELQMSSEEIYQTMLRHIETVNGLIASTADYADFEFLDPRKGDVIFGSGLGGWAFTLPQAAQWLAALGKPENYERYLSFLWGDHYYDREAKKVVTTNISAQGKLPRFFPVMWLEPLAKISGIATSRDEKNNSNMHRVLSRLELTLTAAEMVLPPRQLARRVLSKWLPLDVSFKKFFVERAPSPAEDVMYASRILPHIRPEERYSRFAHCPQPLFDERAAIVVYVTKTVAVGGPKGTNPTTTCLGRVVANPEGSFGEHVFFSIHQHPEDEDRDDRISFVHNKARRKLLQSLPHKSGPEEVLTTAGYRCIDGCSIIVLFRRWG